MISSLHDIEAIVPFVRVLPSVLALLLVCATPAHAGVKLEGVDGELKANILAHMRLDDEACDAVASRIEYRFDNAPREIRSALRPFGYYHAGIESSLESADDGCWKAVFHIEPGDPVLFGEIRTEVVGAEEDLPRFRALLADTRMRSGERLRHDYYEQLKSQLMVLARELGFFDARFMASQLMVDPAAGTADVSLVMEIGERYRFGDLHIIGDVLEESVVRRFVEFQPGLPFDQRFIRSLRSDLIQGGYFETVDVRTELVDGKTVDVNLTVTEARRIRYGVGVGYGTDTGVIVRGDVEVRRVNRRGHRLEVETELATIRQNVTFDYRIPGRRPQRDFYSVYGGVNRRDSDAVESVAVKVGLRHNRFHTPLWSSAPFLEYLHEWFVQDGEWFRKQVLVPGYAAVFRHADSGARPSRGWRLKLEVAGASKDVLSDSTFLRLWGIGKAILPVTERGRVIFRGELGWMETNDILTVPPAWRFYAGGDSSVRGYDYQSLGPLDDEERAIGGSRVMTGSIEGDWRIRERWSGALFVDAGNVGEGNLMNNLPWSVGFGARWYSPMGPIRVDLAFPQQGEQNFRLHVSMGPDL
jgi:translocation and assembly module TamA